MALWTASSLVVATMVVLSVKPTNLVLALGIGSVAIGFVFKDILRSRLSAGKPLLAQR